MTNTQYNDHRADHKVYIIGESSCVKFMHKGYEISLSACGQESIVFDPDGNPVWETPGTSASAVSLCVQFIDSI